MRAFVTVEPIEFYQGRESSDKPILKAFCRVAPSVRFNVRAMLAARVFFLAAAFNVRTSDAVHARRFDFLAIQTSPGSGKKKCLYMKSTEKETEVYCENENHLKHSRAIRRCRQ